MLKALYDYGVRKKLTLPAGYVNKTVKAYVLLYEDGTFQDIELADKTAVPAPDIGSLANGKDKSNVLMEKRSVVIPAEPTPKSEFFLGALKDGGKTIPMLAACAAALENKETADAIRSRLTEKKIKDSDRISFKVAFQSILFNPEVCSWWDTFRKQFSSGSEQDMQLCLITGQNTQPMKTTTPITGLNFVGGHPRGDALICFDKDAFCSYDLKKAANAPVSEEAFSAVKSALDDLLHTAPTLAGMKFVHWYDFELSQTDDPIIQFGEFGSFGLQMEIEEGEDEDPSFSIEINSSGDPMAELGAVKQANELVRSVKNGTQAIIPDGASYYILLLSGVNGRIMIRRYERGSYEELTARLNQWRDDLSLVNGAGTATIKPCKLTARLIRLMNYQQVDRNPFERLAKELSGITPAVFSAILSGTSLPDSVATRALAYIRSKMLSSDEDAAGNLFKVDACVWQWLKVWLLRNKGKRGMLMKAYNPDYKGVAYHCGAMMAVYETIQAVAMPGVNTTIVQRYYSSAIQTPALVLGRLSQMSIHHLSKMENGWLSGQLKEKLTQISSNIHGDPIPVTLNLEQQSEFALGYYQMTAELNREKQEKIAVKKERKAGETNDNAQKEDN